jgi:GT2 family glycosyltransferase
VDLDRFLRLDSVWQTAGAIWKRESVISLGGFDESLTCWQDVDIHIRALASGFKFKKFLHQSADAYYRRHSGHSISQQNLGSPEKVRSRIHLVDKLQNQYHFKKFELKYLYAHVILAAANYPNPLTTYRLLFNGLGSGHITLAECLGLSGIVISRQSRLIRLSTIKKWSQNLTQKYIPATTVCNVPL